MNEKEAREKLREDLQELLHRPEWKVYEVLVADWVRREYQKFPAATGWAEHQRRVGRIEAAKELLDLPHTRLQDVADEVTQ